MKKGSRYHSCNSDRNCGCDDMFMESEMEECCDKMEMDFDCKDMQLAHAYVPWQYYDQAFSPQEALRKGTLFPELYGVYRIPE